MDNATQNGNSDSDSGQPESLSLSASASTAKGHDRALRILYAAQKRRIRETNKRRDEILKAQAGRRRRSMIAPGENGERDLEHHEVEVDDIEGGSDMDARLLRRMTRAMGEAEEETEQASGSESGEEWRGIKSADPENFQSHPADEDMPISSGDTGALDTEGDSDDPGAEQSTARKYLPDHLFAAALEKSGPRNNVRPSRTTPEARSTTKRRRPPHSRAKDVVVGTRTLRTLSSPASTPLPAPGTTVAPPRIKKFLANALALQGSGKRNSKLSLRWERRPSHLGVLKRTNGAPIMAFARARQH
ncbi:hypothetical protein EDB86DRAFT_2826470 [Lactarius hatsudake]|nr:hypothetical protein EDB86DRAFT_2826470 [Lactarius hatsudake]